jgi:hypothetical protein
MRGVGRQVGRLEEAETEHRDTLTSQNNLALVLRDLGLPENQPCLRDMRGICEHTVHQAARTG